MSETTHKRVGATFREFTKTMEAQQNQSRTNVFKGDSNLVDSPGAFTSRKINIVRDNKKGSTEKEETQKEGDNDKPPSRGKYHSRVKGEHLHSWSGRQDNEK